MTLVVFIAEVVADKRFAIRVLMTVAGGLAIMARVVIVVAVGIALRMLLGMPEVASLLAA